RFLNLAHAQLGTLSALLTAKWVIDWGWNWWVAFLMAIAVGVLTGFVVDRFLVAPLRARSSSPIRLLLLSLGVSQLLLALTYIPSLSPNVANITSAQQRAWGGSYPQPFLSNLHIGGVRGRAIGKVFETSGAAVEDVPVTRIATSLRNSRLVRHHRAWLAIGALAIGLIWPQLPYFKTAGNSFLLTLVLIFAVVGVGLTMLLGWGGQVSLGHFAVVGLGAYITAHLATHGW